MLLDNNNGELPSSCTDAEIEMLSLTFISELTEGVDETPLSSSEIFLSVLPIITHIRKKMLKQHIEITSAKNAAKIFMVHIS